MATHDCLHLVGELLDTPHLLLHRGTGARHRYHGSIHQLRTDWLYLQCLVEVLLMPISYPIIGWFKRHELEYVA